MSLPNVDIIILCDIYGALLTERQLQILRLYYDYDNSLLEISEQLNVTRQAVHDAVAKGSETLKNYEAKLGLKEKNQKIAALAQSIIDSCSQEEIAAKAAQIKKILGE